jgi:hypothetical protein
MMTGKLAGNPFFNDDDELSPLYLPLSVCLSLSSDDIGWISKIHAETIARKKLTKILFPTKLCQDIEFCPKLETKKVVEEEIDAPYW